MFMSSPLKIARSSSPRSFPKEFLFGAATAAYQIEGAAFEDGRKASIWDTFAREPGAVLNGDNGDIACDHYHLFPEDVKLMAEMGLETYRFSVSWARVCPDGKTLNQKGLDFYRRLVDQLKESNIKPWLTLYHWDLPQALQDQGGWPNRDTANYFVDYALKVYDCLGDQVDTWTTLNEPWCSSFLSYTAGVHAPGHLSMTEGMLASHHLLLGHGQVIRELRQQNSQLNLGLTLNLTVPEPYDTNSDADRDAARRIDGQFNRWFLEPIFKGHYPKDVLEDFKQVDEAAVQTFEEAILPGDMEVINSRIDSLGVNYYHGEIVSGTRGPVPPQTEAPTTRLTASPFPSTKDIYWIDSGLPRTGMGWDVDPALLTSLLVRVEREYTGPAGVTMYVTENGAAYDDAVSTSGEVSDPDRTAFLELHLGAVLDAIEGGANVAGYFYWSLLDNYEWAWGYSKRFGIVWVDYDNQQRIIKQSGKKYRDIIASRQIDVAELAGEIIRGNVTR